MALTKINAWNKLDPGRVAQVVVWGVRGTDGEAYVMEVDPATGAFPITFGSLSLDFGASTGAQRTAALIGNASGAADWSAGNATAQTLRVVIASDQIGTIVKPEFSAAFAPVDGNAIVLTANTWAQLVASTSAKAVRISYFQDSGYAIELGFGGAGAEASKVVLAESGEEDLLIPAGTRLSLRCKTTNTLNVFWASFLV
jgi:hypothetical protein